MKPTAKERRELVSLLGTISAHTSSDKRMWVRLSAMGYIELSADSGLHELCIRPTALGRAKGLELAAPLLTDAGARVACNAASKARTKHSCMCWQCRGARHCINRINEGLLALHGKRVRL